MTNSNLFARAITFVAAHALLFAVLAVTDGASAREGSRAVATRNVITVQTVAAKSGDKNHHRHGHRFVWIDRPNDDWLIAHRCVVYRIGPDGYPVRVVVRRTPQCRAAFPAAGILGFTAY